MQKILFFYLIIVFNYYIDTGLNFLQFDELFINTNAMRNPKGLMNTL